MTKKDKLWSNVCFFKWFSDQEPLNSGDDVSDEEDQELFDTENVVVCQYDKVRNTISDSTQLCEGTPQDTPFLSINSIFYTSELSGCI